MTPPPTDHAAALADTPSSTTTATGIPISPCDTCTTNHPITRRHCTSCGGPSLFLGTRGLCPSCAHPRVVHA